MSSTDYGISARRRALNIIWTAAGEYGFEPAFMAFSQDGNPDLYMNSIIGYVRKWYDRQIMQELFDTIGVLAHARELLTVSCGSVWRTVLLSARWGNVLSSPRCVWHVQRLFSSSSLPDPASSGWHRTALSTRSSLRDGTPCWGEVRDL